MEFQLRAELGHLYLIHSSPANKQGSLPHACSRRPKSAEWNLYKTAKISAEGGIESDIRIKETDYFYRHCRMVKSEVVICPRDCALCLSLPMGVNRLLLKEK